jgi:hypothetical protein
MGVSSDTLSSPLYADARLVYLGATVAFTAAGIIMKRSYLQQCHLRVISVQHTIECIKNELG